MLRAAQFANLDQYDCDAASLINSAIETTAEAQFLVVLHDCNLIDYCIEEAAHGLGLISPIENVLKVRKANLPSLSNRDKQKHLRDMWGFHSPLAKAQLDFRFRLMLKQSIMNDEERNIVQIFEHQLTEYLRFFFSFGEQIGDDWITLLIALGEADKSSAMHIIQDWEDSFRNGA